MITAFKLNRQLFIIQEAVFWILIIKKWGVQ